MPDSADTVAVEEALAVVKAAGYVVLKEKSYRQAQERQRVAQVLKEYADEDAERARTWARECLACERHLRDRLTYLYGLACKLGATREQIRGDDEDAQKTTFLDTLTPIAKFNYETRGWDPIAQIDGPDA